MSYRYHNNSNNYNSKYHRNGNYPIQESRYTATSNQYGFARGRREMFDNVNNVSTQHYNNSSKRHYNNTNMDNNANVSYNELTQLYMGDIDPLWNEDDIKQIWSSIGVENITVKIMWRFHNNNSEITYDNNNNQKMKNQGYCFIEFPSNLEASNALTKNGSDIPGYPSRRLKLNWASANALNSKGFNVVNKNFSVFVGDLAPTVTEEQLFELFLSKYPSTENGKVMRDQMTGLSRGFGFVKFGNQDDQKRALREMQNVFLNGRAIKVGPAGKQQTARQGAIEGASNTRSPSQHNKSSTPYGNTEKFTQRAYKKGTSQFSSAIQQPPTLNHMTDVNNTTVFVDGLSSHVNENTLYEYFQPFGTIIDVQIPYGSGCGFIQYNDRKSSELAIRRMQGFPIDNSKIRLSWGRPVRNSEGSEPYESLGIDTPMFGSVPCSFGHTNRQYNGQYNESVKRDYDAIETIELLPGYQQQDTLFISPNQESDTKVADNTRSACPRTTFDRLEQASNGHINL